MALIRLVANCESGAVTEQEMTEAEEAAHVAAQTEAQAAIDAAQVARQAKADARAADLALIGQHPKLPQEVRDALGRLLGN